jgi:hypothetical protein
MRFLRAWRWPLLAACVTVIVVLELTVGAPDPPPTESKVERRVRAVAARGGFPLHEARCIRDSVLPRTFTCLVDGPDDLHLAWEVRWLPDGRLVIRRPDGTRVSF